MRMRQAAPRDEHCDLEVGDLKRTLTEFADELEVRIADDRDDALRCRLDEEIPHRELDALQVQFVPLQAIDDIATDQVIAGILCGPQDAHGGARRAEGFHREQSRRAPQWLDIMPIRILRENVGIAPARWR